MGIFIIIMNTSNLYQILKYCAYNLLDVDNENLQMKSCEYFNFLL